MISFTEKGAEKVQEFLASQSADVQTSGLRVGVRGGGCSGFQYALAFDTERDGDDVFEDHGLRILVDSPSLPYVRARSSTTSSPCRAPASRSTTRTSSRPAAAALPSAWRRKRKSPPSSHSGRQALTGLATTTVTGVPSACTRAGRSSRSQREPASGRVESRTSS